MSVSILIGDCRERMKELPDASVDSVVCDPPYHLTSIVKRFGAEDAAPAKVGATGVYARSSKGFMGQTWDGGDVAFQPETWAEVLRVLKPGGHLVAFSGSRTYHRMTCAIEDAGFEIRDQIMWVYSTGFPKSLAVSGKLRDSLPADALCACVHGCQRTAPSSQSDYPTCRDSDDAQLLGGSDTDQDAPPSQGDAPTHTLSLLRGDGRAATASHSRSSSSDRHSSGRSDSPPSHQSEDCQAGDSEPSGTASNTSSDGLRAGHNSPRHTQRTPHLVVGLAASSSSEIPGYENVNLPRCETCGKFIVQDGLGTALKPSHEPICLARKPLIGSVASNVLAHGCGALNIDGCRIDSGADYHELNVTQGAEDRVFGGGKGLRAEPTRFKPAQGRWPANLCHDGSDEVVAGFPAEAGGGGRDSRGRVHQAMHNDPRQSVRDDVHLGFGDSGSAARFFYCAKATTEERGEGNVHPTVKPIALMRWLVRLVTPPGGTVLDPFAGSGSTLIAADAEQFNAIGCEMSSEYAAIAEKRIRDAAGMFADVKVAA